MAEKNFKHLLSLSPPRTGTTYLFDLFASIPQVREKTAVLGGWDKLLTEAYNVMSADDIRNNPILNLPRRTHAKENVAIHHIMRKDVVCPTYIPSKHFSNGLEVSVENYIKMFNAKENEICLSINPAIHDNCVEIDNNLTEEKLKNLIKNFSNTSEQTVESLQEYTNIKKEIFLKTALDFMQVCDTKILVGMRDPFKTFVKNIQMKTNIGKRFLQLLKDRDFKKLFLISKKNPNYIFSPSIINDDKQYQSTLKIMQERMLLDEVINKQVVSGVFNLEEHKDTAPFYVSVLEQLYPNFENYIFFSEWFKFLSKFTMYEQLESVLTFKSIDTLIYNMEDLNDATQLLAKFNLFDSLEQIQNSDFFAKKNNEMKNFSETETNFEKLQIDTDFVKAIQNKSTSIYNTYR